MRLQNQGHCASITCMIRHYVARRAKVIEDHPHNADARIVRRPVPAGPLPVQATLRSVTSIDAVQLTPSALDSWRAIWVMPPSDIVTVQRV